MTMSLRSRYPGHRFPPEVIGHAIWLYSRFPPSLRMVEEMLAARGITRTDPARWNRARRNLAHAHRGSGP